MAANLFSPALIWATAISAARSIGNPYTPVLIAGNAMLATPVLCPKLKAAAVARSQQVLLALGAPSPDRPDGMDDQASAQPVSARHSRPTRLAAHARAQQGQLPALCQQARPSRAMDRPVHAPTAQERSVRRVHNRVHPIERRDVGA